MNIYRYANVPLDELLHLAEGQENELALEIVLRMEEIGEDQENEFISRIDWIKEEAYDEGYRKGEYLGEINGYQAGQADGRNELLESLCPACAKLVGGR